MDGKITTGDNDSMDTEDFHHIQGIKEGLPQSGGTMNAKFLRLGLIDAVSIVIAPCLIGGENTQSLIGGESLHIRTDLFDIKALKLKRSNVWGNSYLHLEYEVINDTVVDNIKS